MRIALTAGHGAGDPGNTWGGYREADLMTELRYITAAKLRAMGHDVREDGERGVNWSLAQAMGLIDSASVAIELHTNASSNTSATGVEVVSLPQHRVLSQRLAKAIGSVLQIPLRRDVGWLSHDRCTAERGFQPGFSRRGGLIVEVFFQSNAQDLRKYLERRSLVASAIANEVTA